MPVERKTIEIRWRDLDGLGHVNNAVYLTYLEEARTAWVSRHLPEASARFDYVLARCAIDYRSQVTLDDGHVEVEVDLLRIGRTSVSLAERILAGPARRLAAESQAVIVRYDWEVGAPCPIDPAIASILAASTAETPSQAPSAAASGERPSARPSA
jgi:acyl-CoA thioester hydrolase